MLIPLPFRESISDSYSKRLWIWYRFGINYFRYPLFFISYLLKIRFNRGHLHKEYVSHSYNDPSLRGKLDILRFIKEDIPFLGKVAYSRREFSFDNGMTELIRCTIDYIERQKHLSFVLSDVQSEVREVKEITTSYRPQNRKRIVEWNKRHMVRNGFYSDYRPLQMLCLDILQNDKSALGSNQDQVYGVLFDCAWLWEEYVNLLIGEEFYHPRNKGGENKKAEGAQHLLCDGKNLDNTVYPDFISKQSPHTIADAKYKPVEKINSEDRRRMIEYLWRFDSMPGYFIYPETAGEERYKKWFKPEGFNSKAFGGNESESSAQLDSLVAIVACGVKIPQEAENYGVFPAVMEKEEEKFKKEFLNRIANHGKG